MAKRAPRQLSFTDSRGSRGSSRSCRGIEAAAGAWERAILPARLVGYDSAWLDALCLSGGVAWGRLAARPAGGTPTRAAPIALCRRADLPWLLVPETESFDETALSAPARDVLGQLSARGASFLDELITGTRRLRTEVEDALGELVSAGRVTGDGFSGLRALISATQTRGGARARWHSRWSRRTGGPVGAGRWAVLRHEQGAQSDPNNALAEETRHEALARQYIKRYGVVFRDLLAREAHAPVWRDLVRIYRRMEMSGELRGGRLVGGFVGEQFAAPEAVDALRATRREEKTGRNRPAVGLRPLEPGRNRDARTACPGDPDQHSDLHRRRSTAAAECRERSRAPRRLVAVGPRRLTRRGPLSAEQLLLCRL